MAGKRYGKAATRLTLVPGAEVDEEQDGSLKGRATYKGDISLWDTRPKKGSVHPYNRNLFCYSARTRYTGLKLCTVDAEYIGLSADPTPYFVEFCGSVGEEAIETHPHFATVIGGTASNPLNSAVFDDDGSFLGFPADAGSHLGGVRAYFRPSFIVRLSYWQNEVPNPGPLGAVYVLAGLPIVVPSNCANMLVTNFGYRTLAPQMPPFQCTLEMLGSGPLGWNPLIYY